MSVLPSSGAPYHIFQTGWASMLESEDDLDFYSPYALSIQFAVTRWARGGDGNANGTDEEVRACPN